MSASAPAASNAERRAQILALFEARLRDVWPDDGLPARNFNDLEAIATRTGDGIAQELMNATLRQALELPASARPEHCPKCGTTLQWSKKPRTVVTIRGPVTFERDYGHCRECRKGFLSLSM